MSVMPKDDENVFMTLHLPLRAKDSAVKNNHTGRENKQVEHDFKKDAPSKNAPIQAIERHFRVCINCNRIYQAEKNHVGSCNEAPDPIKSIIRCISCRPVVDCSMHHCISDTHDDYEANQRYENDDECARGWILGCLSLLLPCVCFYPALQCCYSCGVKRQIWGGRHRPIMRAQKELNYSYSCAESKY